MTKEMKIEYENEELEFFEEKYKKLKKLLKECKKEKAEYLDGWQRARAEFQNTMKKVEGDREEFRKFAASDVLLKFLPVLDNFKTALENAPSDTEKEWLRGMGYIEKQIEDILLDSGIEEVKTEKGMQFDPAKHEAVEEIKSKEKKGAISEIIQKGYALHGKIIRVTRVKIAK